MIDFFEGDVVGLGDGEVVGFCVGSFEGLRVAMLGGSSYSLSSSSSRCSRSVPLCSPEQPFPEPNAC